jgi:hypothetical protein
MTIGDFLNRLEGVKSQKNGWIARCPAHDDRKASLSVKLEQKRSQDWSWQSVEKGARHILAQLSSDCLL